MRATWHVERHRTAHIGWLRAAVLGANDGLISTASLVVGVAAAGTARSAVLIAGVAGLVAGAMSMAAGEFVSVSSQLDTERADVARERKELATQPEFEKRELAAITRCASVNLGVLRGFEADVSQSYHNRIAHLPRVPRYRFVLVETRVMGQAKRHFLAHSTTSVPRSMFIPQTNPIWPDTIGVNSIVTG